MDASAGLGERTAASPFPAVRQRDDVALRVDDDDALVMGYLSAVAAALDERGILVLTLCRDEQHPEALSGTLALHPATARLSHGWGPTRASWHQNTGWAIQFSGGINGHLATGRYLCSQPAPSPAAVAGFVAAVAAGRDIGTSIPPRFDANRQELVAHLDRFRPGRGRGRGGPALPPAARTPIDDLGRGGQTAGRSDVMPPAVPAPHQHEASLAKAALARAARRQLREQISRGELSIAAVLDRVGTDPVVARTRVIDLLSALPGYGRVTVTVLLCDARIHPSRRAGGLGRRQRRALLDALAPGSPRAGRSGFGMA
jgi:hypothetical protein